MKRPTPPANRLCAKCLRPCKQPPEMVLVECPRYLPPPFKIERRRYDQLALFDDEAGEKED